MNRSLSSQDPLEDWLEEVIRPALAYALSLVNNREDAEDVVHDCVMRLLAKADEYDLPRDGRKLLYRSITNASINLTRRRPRQVRLVSESAPGGVLESTLPDRRASDPSATSIQQELEAAVAEALGELPLLQRAAMQFRSLGYSMTEIAEMLEISPGHARVILHRARAALKIRLRPFLEEKRNDES